MGHRQIAVEQQHVPVCRVISWICHRCVSRKMSGVAFRHDVGDRAPQTAAACETHTATSPAIRSRSRWS